MGYILTLLFWLPVWLPTKPETRPISYYTLSWPAFYDLPAARQPINLQDPDYDLLNAAIFQATNKVRSAHGKVAFQYLNNLYQSADFHAQAMLQDEFFDHYNLRQALYLTPDKRIRAFGGFFQATSENIARYDIIDTGPEYCPARQPYGDFKYLDCKTHQAYRVFTYLAYAEAIVAGWMNSPPHRATILSSQYQYLGCAARISKDPFKQRTVPYACLTQNFGGYLAGNRLAQPNIPNSAGENPE